MFCGDDVGSTALYSYLRLYLPRNMSISCATPYELPPEQTQMIEVSSFALGFVDLPCALAAPKFSLLVVNVVHYEPLCESPGRHNLHPIVARSGQVFNPKSSSDRIESFQIVPNSKDFGEITPLGCTRPEPLRTCYLQKPWQVLEHTFKL